MSSRIAYLINQYPKVSHSFIRREILALESLGLSIDRFALRGWADTVVDAQDALERTRTRYLLEHPIELIAALLKVLLLRPWPLLQACVQAWRLSRMSDRPWPVHLVYVLEACLLWTWCRQQGIRHVHAHFGTNATEVAMHAASLGQVTYSFTVHGPEEFDGPVGLHLRDKIHHAQFVAAISSFGRSQLYRWIQRHQWHKVQVVRCGLDEHFTRIESSSLPQGDTLLCIGRLCEQKGQLLLVQAFRQLIDQGVNARLVLAGDGEMRAAIEAEIRTLQLESLVNITGWISGERVKELLEQSRAMVLPSFAEGLPVVIMEALARGRPVISTAIAGIPELVEHGKSGWLCPAGDVDELAQAMKACMDTPLSELAAMGQHGRQQVLARHDIKTEARKLAKLFAYSPLPKVAP
jgi:colanic acid/amylovoran biosynthesis glycosyltransferase